MDNFRIKMQMSGSPPQEERVLLKNFTNQLKALQRTLEEVDHIFVGPKKKSLTYTVVDLGLNSPINVTIEGQLIDPEIDYRENVHSLFFSGLDDIVSRGSAPKEFNLRVLQSIKEFTSTIGRGFSRVKLFKNGSEIDIAEPLGASIDKILGGDKWESGAINGMLEALNIHDNRNACVIYPEIGAKKINGFFSSSDFQKILEAVGKNVTVFGQIAYKERENFPYEIKIEDIEVLPDEDQLPTLSSFIGVAPNATGDLSTQEFIRNIRNEWK